MSVKIRPYRRGGWEVDIRFDWPDGSAYRERRCSPVDGKSATTRWAQQREVELLRAGKISPLCAEIKREVPTLKDFWPDFIAGHCKANRQKPSGIERKQCVFRNQLATLYEKPLDEILNADVQALKASMSALQPKSMNNVLTTLATCLRFAGEMEKIPAMACRIKLLKVQSRTAGWHERADYGRLVDAAGKIDPRIHALVLLGGDAGLRRGEIIALKWSDLDFTRNLVHVRRSIWNGQETEPEGMHARIVPMTTALRGALQKARHVRGERVLYSDAGEAISNKIVRNWIERAERRAGLPATGAIHILRHTFCSLLAAEGATPKEIQELAGHQNIGTTMRYMHLSPSSRVTAIKLLDRARSRPLDEVRGDIVEAETRSA